AGSVAGLRRVKNPIQAARAVLENSPHMMLIGEGAEKFATEHGVSLCDPLELVSPAEREAWERCRVDSHAAAHHRGHEQGTVGAVALDDQGRLFAATSTGGTCCKLPGRVGDSPLIGCGCYADHETGAVSSTGFGEAIMRVVLAKTACDFLRPAASTPARAAQAAVQLLAKRGKGTGGLILLDKSGTPGIAFNTPRMAYALVNPDGSLFAAV
ncbi:MAG: peptidase T, partial [Verrucomicrobia bacterium]